MTTFGEWPLKRLMTEVCGSGHKSADDLSREQASDAFERIIAGKPDPTTLGAFWLANRWKRNTPTELAAYTDLMCEHVDTAAPDCDPVDCGANYDGKGRSAILGVGAGVVAAAAGTPVVVHSGDRVPTQKQDAYKHVLDELGVPTELSPQTSAEMVDATGFGFYYQPAFNPTVDELFDRRDQMGVRTFLNTIETLANPAGANVHLGSFYHLPFAKKIVDTFQESDHHDLDRVLMFQGMEGYDDIRPGLTKSPSGTPTAVLMGRRSTISRSKPPTTGWISRARICTSTPSPAIPRRSPRPCWPASATISSPTPSHSTPLCGSTLVRMLTR
jgi:Anthranilate phosphoribosyltransferase